MEYELMRAPGKTVEMVRWKPEAKPSLVDAIEIAASLSEVGDLANATNREILDWISRYGFLGFRNVGGELPQQLGLTYSILLGVGHFHAYEPLSSIREAARVAAAATALYAALRIGEAHKRAAAIQNIIQINHATRVGGRR
jgi:hypothetical protein